MSLQEGLGSYDDASTLIPGNVIFREKLLPDIATLANTNRQASASAESLATMWSPYNTLFHSIKEKCIELLKEGAESRKQKKKIRKEAPPAFHEAAAASQSSTATTFLYHTLRFCVKTIEHYKWDESESWFYPVYRSEHTVTVKVWRGDCKQVVEKESAGHAGFTANATYVDCPWGWHQNAPYDAKAWTPAEVMCF